MDNNSSDCDFIVGIFDTQESAELFNVIYKNGEALRMPVFSCRKQK